MCRPEVPQVVQQGEGTCAHPACFLLLGHLEVKAGGVSPASLGHLKSVAVGNQGSNPQVSS